MAIRIREVDGYVVALCAAISEEKQGDLYLDDNIHHALSTKFGLDWKSEGVLQDAMADPKLVIRMQHEQGGLLT